LRSMKRLKVTNERSRRVERLDTTASGDS
jgi:hypothetical protein